MSNRGTGPILILAAVMCLGILVFAWYSPAPHAQMQLPPASTIEKPPQTRRQVKRSGSAHKRIKPESASLPEISESQLPTGVYEMRVSAPPFPRQGDLGSGLTSTKIKEKFGNPDFSASWTESGSLVEKYIYFGPRESTTIVVDDGAVRSVRTEPSVISVAP